ncbi:MAG: NAD-dependent epimerase/dehydratase family protein, partial [bacterium]
GACGFTGSHLVDILHEKKLDFRATDMETADTRYLPEGTEFIPSDLTEPKSLKKVAKGVDVVLHTAAIFYFSAPRELLYSVNVQGMENLCNACVEAGVKRLVSWSTSGVYGRGSGEVPVREDHPKAPVEEYSMSKLEQDKIAHRFCEEGKLATTIVRPGVVYGPRAKYGFAQILEYLSGVPIIPVPVNFYYRIAPVHARDVGGAALHLSRRKEAVGEEYHVVDSSGISMTNLFYMIAAVMEKPTIPVFVPPKLAAFGGTIAATIMEAVARLTGKPPILEKAPMKYFPIDLDVSNEKLLATGYKFEYPDVRIGLIETIDWMKEEGRLDVNLLEKIV